jgi:intracellular sulfur oxidation DsrE/DsrF family protein
MNADDKISEELLNAFADNELDAAERSALLERIAADGELRAKVCELWHLKELVRTAHPLPERPSRRRGARRPALPWAGWALAATLLLAVGGASGWFAHEEYDENWIPGPQLEAIRSQGSRVVLHLTSDDPAQLASALRKAEQLASTRDRKGHPLQVEVIANGTGIQLLQARADQAGQVAAIRAAHQNNLHLVACALAIEKAQERGLEVTLLPEVDVVPNAVDRIAARLNQGWRYVQA